MSREQIKGHEAENSSRLHRDGAVPRKPFVTELFGVIHLFIQEWRPFAASLVGEVLILGTIAFLRANRLTMILCASLSVILGMFPGFMIGWKHSAELWPFAFKRSRISRPPGLFLNSIANFFCSNKVQREIANPLIADMQFEYNQALLEKRRTKAAWIRVRGCWLFFYTLGFYRVLKAVAGMFQQARPRS
jgi:hypothetical protein